MRESDEGSGKATPDREETARSSAPAGPRKRFYARVGVNETPEGFAILLDDRPVRTPSRNVLAAPVREIAETIAAEWDAQHDLINPMTMPLTRLANSIIDGVTVRVDAVVEDIAKYLETDLLFYRASHPDALVAREATQWDPVLQWAAEALGARFIPAEGIVHVRQPDQAVTAVRKALPTDPWVVGALHVVTTLTGSALLAIALMRGRLDADEVWAAACVDEDWNSEQWGVDEEAAVQRAVRLVDFRAAATVLRARVEPAG
ncbi:Chaperone required for the assembly of F1-ATPase [Nitrobacter winogradskyi Nb-255]|uniref:Chaperone required for the assembly of F1-ATPase n=1 Tax=Nitrobacter winogradskyi (strain ATCC 25391 / DSM 10237 / CIP 104748 / NCIMB 11846 / Nb-255) TaxID=323098 RepID=Q3SST2_NITWN|nr:ATP12 family protein [Nitrobacter winogradskyi]ABA04659.1 Chaperone required for the assembly of F1-ATPase [Nitrobacter winogradskyi Nb-255]